MFITKQEYLSTFFFLGRSMFLGVGFSYIFRFAGKDSWISIILGYLLGNLFILIYDKISKNINYNLNNFLNKQKIFHKLFKILFFVIYLYLIVYASIIFTNFVKVYYLFETPIWVTLLVLFSISYYATLKSEFTIIRISMILIPISIVINLLNGLLLVPYSEVNNFLPFMTTNISNIFIGAIVFAVFSSIPNILLLEYKVSLKTKLFSYFIVFAIIFLINGYTIGVLGEFLSQNYNYPEYMVLRRIKFLDFIENIENFASIVWYFDIFIIITLSLSKIRKMFYTKKKDIIIPPLIIIITLICFSIFSQSYTAIINFFGIGVLTLTIFLILSGPLLLLVTKKETKN